MNEIFSIGHSTDSYASFRERLASANITAVADVRSIPFSRHLPHFNREPLREALAEDGIAYVFLGQELGGRPESSRYYTDGIADYEKMAQSQKFLVGLERLEKGVKQYRVAMMCSEQNPIDCHRCLLVGREIRRRDYSIIHIRASFEFITQEEIERQLLMIAGKNSVDMFLAPEEQLNQAYRDRSRKVAYSENFADG